MDPVEVVRGFCDAFERRDMDELLGFFTEDAVYHNIPLEPAQGREQIRGVLQMFVPPASAIGFEVLNIAAAGDVVLTERVDRFTIGEAKITLPVAGVFEVRDGKIAAWRDYFDLQQFMGQMPQGT